MHALSLRFHPYLEKLILSEQIEKRTQIRRYPQHPATTIIETIRFVAQENHD